MSDILPVRMPKWGLSMQEGAIVSWWKKEGDLIGEGDDLVDIETSKITNVCESPGAGVLRRIVAKDGETLPVGALIAVLADAGAADADLDVFIADFQSRFTPGDDGGEAEGALRLETVQAGSRSVRVGRAGEGSATPAVLIHGFSGDLNNWLFNIEALAARGPVIALDMPGHGGSSKDVGDGALETLAQTLGQALDALEVGKAHLIGHSLGAAVVARLALDRPTLAASLTLICPAYMPGGEVSGDFLTGVAEAQRAKDLKPWLEQLTADPAMISKDMVEDVLKFKRTDGADEALTALKDRMIEGSDGAALRADLGQLSNVLVIASHGDRIVGAPDQAALPESWRIVWMDDSGHMPHLEQAERVNVLLVEQVG